jgi:hypothetical protein
MLSLDLIDDRIEPVLWKRPNYNFFLGEGGGIQREDKWRGVGRGVCFVRAIFARCCRARLVRKPLVINDRRWQVADPSTRAERDISS